MNAVFGYLVEGALMLMLGVAIFYGWRLNRQMAVIRSGREELQKLIGDFSNATGRAEAALAELKGEVAETLTQSREASHKAAGLCDDLEFLIKRGEKVADALEVGIRAGRKIDPKAETAASGTSGPPARAATGRGLAAAPEDRPDEAVGQKSAPVKGGAAKKARAKSKSDLLKALQDMR